MKRFSSWVTAGAIVLCMVSSSVFQASAAEPDKGALMQKGQKVFNEYCKTCHQATGLGIPGVYPPLAKSDYLKSQDKKKIIQNLVWGLQGEITVNGKKYNSIMPPVPGNYKDEDIAAALTYVYNSFGNSGPVVTPTEVTKVRKEGKPAPAKGKK